MYWEWFWRKRKIASVWAAHRWGYKSRRYNFRSDCWVNVVLPDYPNAAVHIWLRQCTRYRLIRFCERSSTIPYNQSRWLIMDSDPRSLIRLSHKKRDESAWSLTSASFEWIVSEVQNPTWIDRHCSCVDLTVNEFRSVVNRFICREVDNRSLWLGKRYPAADVVR